VRSNQSMGLDLGTSAVRAAEISVGAAGPRLERFAQIGLPPGALSGGAIREPAAVTAALKRLRAVGQFRSTHVAIGVANERVVVRQVEVPWMPAAELRAALAFHIQDSMPIPVEEAVLDYHPVEEFLGPDGCRMLRAFVVAADTAMIQSILSVVRAAGLRPTVVDLTAFALLRVATLNQAAQTISPDSVMDLDEPARPVGPDTVTEAVVDVGAAYTNVIVHSGGVPRFVQILPQGGDDVTDYLAERLSVARDDAEARKRGTGHQPDQTPDEAHHQRQIQQAAIARLVAQISASLDHYRGQPGAQPLTRLVVSGGGTLLRGLPEQLRMASRLPVAPNTPMTLLPNGSGLSARAVKHGDPFVAVPLGLALRMAA